MVLIHLLSSSPGLPFAVCASQCMTCFGSLPSFLDNKFQFLQCCILPDLLYRIGTYCDIFKNIKNFEKIIFFRYFRYIYRAFAHTLLKCNIYYTVCVCALHIR